MMQAPAVREGAAIIIRTADMLLGTSQEKKGRAGSDLRRYCGDIKANAESYIVNNIIANKLSVCFEQARIAGASLDDFNRIRESILAEVPVLPIAQWMKSACLSNALQQMALTVIEIAFTSREDVDRVSAQISAAFYDAAEIAADEMESEVYRSTIELHASVTMHLYETARPLPRMMRYEFAAIRPTLVLSHRLYDTASRADELRRENKVVHPAFASRSGRALGA
jgi:prophage DNA circulation protein